MKATPLIPVAAALLLSGCATGYQLTLMPRDSGKTYSGTMQGSAAGEGRLSVTIEGRTYEGTWVESAPSSTYGWVSGGYGYRRGWGGMGGTIMMDNPSGGEAKALLTAADGSGLRCDFRSSYSFGGGVCRDDKGREYDVQIRPLAEKR
jgi:hypothetical protein